MDFRPVQGVSSCTATPGDMPQLFTTQKAEVGEENGWKDGWVNK